MAITIVTILTSSLTGCLQPKMEAEDSMKGECEFYPDQDYLNDTWNSQANNSREGHETVGVEVQFWEHWNGDEQKDEPELFVDWVQYPEDDRPDILVDVLCTGLGRLLDGGRYVRAITGAPKFIGEGAMTALVDENIRQTGEAGWEDECCIIWYEGHFWAAGCRDYQATMKNGTHYHTTCEY